MAAAQPEKDRALWLELWESLQDAEQREAHATEQLTSITSERDTAVREALQAETRASAAESERELLKSWQKRVRDEATQALNEASTVTDIQTALAEILGIVVTPKSPEPAVDTNALVADIERLEEELAQAERRQLDDKRQITSYGDQVRGRSHPDETSLQVTRLEAETAVLRHEKVALEIQQDLLSEALSRSRKASSNAQQQLSLISDGISSPVSETVTCGDCGQVIFTLRDRLITESAKLREIQDERVHGLSAAQRAHASCKEKVRAHSKNAKLIPPQLQRLDPSLELDAPAESDGDGGDQVDERGSVLRQLLALSAEAAQMQGMVSCGAIFVELFECELLHAVPPRVGSDVVYIRSPTRSPSRPSSTSAADRHGGPLHVGDETDNDVDDDDSVAMRVPSPVKINGNAQQNNAQQLNAQPHANDDENGLLRRRVAQLQATLRDTDADKERISQEREELASRLERLSAQFTAFARDAAVSSPDKTDKPSESMAEQHSARQDRARDNEDDGVGDGGWSDLTDDSVDTSHNANASLNTSFRPTTPLKPIPEGGRGVDGEENGDEGNGRASTSGSARKPPRPPISPAKSGESRSPRGATGRFPSFNGTSFEGGVML